MTKKMKAVSYCFICLFYLVGFVYAGPVPDTGQTKCYDNSGEIPCPQAGETFYGQDANYSINPPLYTKLDANGNNLPDEATSWVMIRDNVTGLIWEVKQSKDDTYDYSNPHDADNTYTWYDSNLETNGGDAGTAGDGTDTEDFINAIKAENFGGFSDWRMPTKEELQSIVNYGRHRPAIDTSWFPHTACTLYTNSSFYWSATTSVNAGYAWYVSFYDGSVQYGSYEGKSGSFYARAVRAGQPGSLGDLLPNGDGTVTDPNTGLMWQQEDDGQQRSWESALSYCENLPLANYTDWRLPTAKELSSIVDVSKYGPAIDQVFSNTESSYYWSSTTSAGSPYAARLVSFYNGDLDYISNKSSGSDYVRAVRNTQISNVCTNKVLVGSNLLDARDVYNFTKLIDGQNNLHVLASYDIDMWARELTYFKIDYNGNIVTKDIIHSSNEGSRYAGSQGLVTDDLGYVYIAYYHNETGEYFDDYGVICYRKLDPSGNIITNRDIDNTTIQGAPSIVLDASGNPCIIYSDKYDHLYFAKLNNDGDILINPKLITSYSSSLFPRLAFDGSDILMYWQAIEESTLEIYFTRLDDEGNKLISELRLTDTGKNTWSSSFPPYLDPLGQLHMLVNDEGLANGKTHCYYLAIDKNGSIVHPMRKVCDVQTAEWSNQLSIVPDAEGKIYVTYEYMNESGGDNIRTALINAAGTITDSFDVHNFGNRHTSEAAFIPISDGKLHLIYTDDTNYDWNKHAIHHAIFERTCTKNTLEEGLTAYWSFDIDAR
ncbi:DUF1566 domain-containing protein, partial [Thermodesulfobacteriota bacterium]